MDDKAHKNDLESDLRDRPVLTSVSKAEFVAAVTSELRDHFRWSSVEGLVESEVEIIAAFAFQRLRDRERECA